jgi:hypothetical protein
MNKLGQYDDGRSNYSFNFSDNDGKHISVSFRAEPDYDLNMVFNEFKNFLIASGHDVENDIGEIHAYDESHQDADDDSYPQSWGKEADNILVESIDAMKQHQSADKFSMESFPNNGWPFGDLTTPSSPRLTTTDFASLTPNQFPTMAPLTQEQVQSWTLSSMDIQALTSADLSRWTVPSPGTIGGAKVSFPIPGPHGGGGIYK